MNEVWKDVKGYENSYQISNLGRLKSLPKKGNYKNEHIRKTFTDVKGYLVCNLVKDKKYKYVRIHRLVAQAFISNPNNLPQVNHKDGNKQNNCVNNLEWCTNSENQLHAIKMGLRKSENISKGRKKEINQYDLNGNYIKTWESAKDVKLYYNSKAHIEDVCKGKRNKALGYIWKYSKKIEEQGFKE